MRIRFEPLRKFSFEAGQFLTVIVPRSHSGEGAKRCYSLASSPLEAEQFGRYELCVKYATGGIGTGYMASLRAGDTFQIRAAFGHFKYNAPSAGRAVAFVSSGSGLAPFRSMIMSKEFQVNRPEHALCLVGVRTESEIMYRREIEKAGVETVYAVSQAGKHSKEFSGRVTDYLRSLPRTFGWHTTDFYLCGNGPMVEDVSKLLRGSFGVATSAIHKEAFSATQPGRPKVATRQHPVAKPREIAEPEEIEITISGIKDAA